jgi:hypothetical protein
MLPVRAEIHLSPMIDNSPLSAGRWQAWAAGTVEGR